MSLSFKSIKGFNNKVNLGDSSYSFNSNKNNFNKNSVSFNGNPSNWNGNHNIKKQSRQSTHTRYIEKIGSEVVNQMNRNEEHFSDRMQEHISLYPKNQHLMADGIDYGGSTPYKIGQNGQGSAAVTCSFNVNDYVKNPVEEHALSRMPVTYVNAQTNITPNSQENYINTSYYKPTHLKSIKEDYLHTNITPNKVIKNHFIQDQRDFKELQSSLQPEKLHKQVNSNGFIINNYNNNQNNNNKLPINEYYKNISTNTNLRSNKHIQNSQVDVSNNIKHGTLLSANIHTNKHVNSHKTNFNRNVELYKNKVHGQAMTNKTGEHTYSKDNRNVHLSREKINTNVHTNIKKNSNEIESYRANFTLNKNTPHANFHTNKINRSNHVEQFKNRNIDLPETLSINNHYNNNNIGPRAQTKNLQFNL